MPEVTTTPPTEGGGLDAAAVTAMIDERVAAGVTQALKDRASSAPAAATGTPPAASPPAAGGAQTSAPEGLAAAVDAALARAFKERDDEDALGMLEREIAELKASVGTGGGKRKRGWGGIIVGMGR